LRMAHSMRQDWKIIKLQDIFILLTLKIESMMLL